MDTENVASGSDHHRALMAHLQMLRPFALVTTGRTGSDYLQSLLDSHPAVLTFNGVLMFYGDFWSRSVCARVADGSVEDLADEFIGRHIDKLKSRYDLVERKGQLGPDRNESIAIDSAQFKAHLVALMGGKAVTSRNILLAAYGAYHLCLGRSLDRAAILFAHVHHFDELALFLKDFPDAAVVVTTRDPRANLVAGVENWRAFSTDKDHARHFYRYIRRILIDATPCQRLRVRYIVVRLEDLPKPETLNALCQWLGIAYAPTLTESTWGGLKWHGDALSRKTDEASSWEANRSNNGWERRLGRLDQYVLNYIMYHRLRHYGYPCRAIRWWDAALMPLAILAPMKYERRFFGWSYIAAKCRSGSRKDLRDLLINPLCYVLRVQLFLGYYIKTLRGIEHGGEWVGSRKMEHS